AATTGISREGINRLTRKAKIIPDTDDENQLNQYLFPANKAERLIDHIQNSIPLCRVHDVLGCSEKQAALLAQHKLISSATPNSDRASELSTLYFNQSDLEAF